MIFGQNPYFGRTGTVMCCCLLCIRPIDPLCPGTVGVVGLCAEVSYLMFMCNSLCLMILSYSILLYHHILKG